MVTSLSSLENLGYSEDLTKEVKCHCRGEKKYVDYSNLRIDEDCMVLMDSRGVKLIHEVGCDENGYFIYVETEN